MFADDFQQNKRIVELVNNISNKSVVSASWQSSTGSYGVMNYNYINMLTPGRTYYACVKVKYDVGTGSARNWITMYNQNGYATWGTGSTINNPVAGTEYTLNSVTTVGSVSVAGASILNHYGTIYSGDSGTVAGTTNYWKEIQVIDITDILVDIDRMRGATDQRTWCLANIPFFVDKYYFTINDNGTWTGSATFPLQGAVATNANFTKGVVTAKDFVESDCLISFGNCSGGNLHYDPYLDAGTNGTSVYNNSGGGTVVHTRISALADTPFPSHLYNLQIVTNGTASPGAGGIYCGWASYSGAVFLEKFVAKIPAGYSVYDAANAQGDGATTTWLTSQAGTGAWKEYAMLRRCGTTGSFSSGGHLYLSGTNNTSVTWYLAYIGSYDVTLNQNVIYAPLLEASARMKDEIIYTPKEFNSKNLITNGDGRHGLKGISNASWTLNYSDVKNRATASFSQPFGVSPAWIGDYIPIQLGKKYVIKAWAKRYTGGDCLAALHFYNSGYSELSHTIVMYKSGTKTTLANQLNNGDTTVTLTSSANWVVEGATYLNRVGFRSSVARSYNDVGTHNSYFTQINGNVLTMNAAYTGSTVAAGTVVVQSRDGGTYWYPLNLQAATWRETNTLFYGVTDGAVGSWSTTAMFPIDARYMRLRGNIYTNNSTASEPLLLSDVAIEIVSDFYDDGRDTNVVTIL